VLLNTTKHARKQVAILAILNSTDKNTTIINIIITKEQKDNINYR